MIGDDIQADVGGAQKAGLQGALVKTGKFRPADLAGKIRPDMVFDYASSGATSVEPSAAENTMFECAILLPRLKTRALQ